MNKEILIIIIIFLVLISIISQPPISLSTLFSILYILSPFFIFALLIFKSFGNRNKYRLLKNTPITPIKNLKEGFAEVYGKVVAFSDPLEFPIDNSPCVFYHLNLKERRQTYTTSNGRRSSHSYLSWNHR